MKLALATLLLHHASTSPVEKIVTLLNEMQSKVEADGAKEEQMYNKFACWCENSAKRKAAAIESAQSEMRKLGQEILSLKGKVAVLTSEMEQLAEDMKENEKAQGKATAVRTKENKEFTKETDEIKEAMAALDRAITTLVAGTQDTELLQTGVGMQLQALQGVKASLEALPDAATARLTPKKMSMLRQYATELSQHKSKYTPASAEIQGILGDMYETFASDLESQTGDEGMKNRDFEDFIAAKQKEFLEMKKVSAKKAEEKAEAEVDLSETTQSYDDTESQMKADTEFFDVSKEKCQKGSEEWEVRKENRETELDGIKEAIEILTSDEAREQFQKSFKSGDASFLQIDSSSDEMAPAIKQAYETIKKQATSTHSLRLARLATNLRSEKSGHFDKVMKAIDEVLQALRDEETEDIEKRDECKDKYQEIESTSKDLEWKIEKNNAKINKLEKMIAKKEAEKTKTIEEIEDVLKNIEGMEVERKEENAAFLQAKEDDKAAIELIKQAKKTLAKFHKEKSFMQKPDEFAVSEDQAPELKFSDADSRKGQSKGILGLMDVLIEDLEVEIKDGQKGEAEAQTEFEESLEAAHNLEKELKEKRVNLSEQIAEHGEHKDDENDKLEDNSGSLADENSYKAEIKPDCDFILRAFSKRDAARQAEMDGLTKAKEYLAGASLLQKVSPHSHLRGSA